MRRGAAILSLLAIVVVPLASGCGGAEEGADGAVPATTVCDAVEMPAAEERTGEEPTDPLPPDARPTLTFATNCGTFTVALDPVSAPRTTASLVALAKAGFYDETIVHRIVPGFVFQGGDPTQTGGGGPGYSTVDRPAADTSYTKGVVAMAKTELEAPGTSGSQWFVVTGDDVGLPPEYAVVGRVTEGLDVVQKIGALGAESQQPTEPVVVSSVTVDGA